MISLANTPTLARAMGAFVDRIGFEGGSAALAEVDQDTFEVFKAGFDMEGPYHFAKRLGVLKNGSGEASRKNWIFKVTMECGSAKVARSFFVSSVPQ